MKSAEIRKVKIDHVRGLGGLCHLSSVASVFSLALHQEKNQVRKLPRGKSTHEICYLRACIASCRNWATQLLSVLVSEPGVSRAMGNCGKAVAEEDTMSNCFWKTFSESTLVFRNILLKM